MGRSRDRSYSRSPSRSKSRSRSGSLSSSSSGRTAKARKWNGEGGYRLHLSDLAIGVSRREIEKLFRPYGPLNEVWVASNPPCFAFINFRHRADAEKALKELDGKVVAGTRIGLTWARPRNYGGRPMRYRSPSPSHRRGYRDSYSSRRNDDRCYKRRYSRSRSRSPDYRRSNGSRRRRSESSPSRSRSRSKSPARDKRQKTSKHDHYNGDERRRNRRDRSVSKSNSDRSDRHHSPEQNNGKHRSRSASAEHQRSSPSNGYHNDLPVETDVIANGDD